MSPPLDPPSPLPEIRADGFDDVILCQLGYRPVHRPIIAYTERGGAGSAPAEAALGTGTYDRR
jgi:hypothetical protein